MQEARSAAYFTHYTNLFGSLSHQAGDSWSLWLMRLQMMLHWCCGVMISWVMMAVVNYNSFRLFPPDMASICFGSLLLWDFSPFWHVGWTPVGHFTSRIAALSTPVRLLHLLLIIACLPHRSVSSSPLSFRPHACEICTCQMLCFPANLCWFLASYWSVSDSMSVSLEV